MAGHTLHVQLSPEAAASLEPEFPGRNRAGRTLHQWLVRSFESTENARLFHPSLFGTAIEVEAETPLLLEALAQIQNATPEVLIESWLMEPPGARQGDAPDVSGKSAVSISEEALGKVAHILDLGETLFERTIADTQHKLGGNYPEGEKVAQASAEVFRALRVLLGLRENKVNAEANGELRV